jgi:hypothetical protein
MRATVRTIVGQFLAKPDMHATGIWPDAASVRAARRTDALMFLQSRQSPGMPLWTFDHALSR